MSLADEIDAPIPVEVGGETFNLGILDLDDLGAIEREIAAEAVAEAVAQLPNSHTAADVQAVRARVGRLTFDGLAQQVFTLAGASRFLARELAKGGSAKDVAEGRALALRIARRLGWREAAEHAANASGLFPSLEEQQDRAAKREKAGNPDPNSGAGSSPATSA